MSVYFVKGNDPLLREEAVGALVADLLGDDDRSFALEEFVVGADARSGEEVADDETEEPSGTPLGAALNAARTLPMMTAKRVVVVRDVGNLASAEVKLVEAYVADPVETTELVLVAGGTARNASKTNAALEKLAKGAGSVAWPASEDSSDVLGRALRDSGIRMRPDAAKVVLANVGADAGLIPGLVTTLASVHGEGAQLEVDDVEPYLTDAGAVPMWDLTNAIERGDSAKGIEVLQRLLTATTPSQPKPLHPLEIMGFLHGHYRRLLRLDDPSVRNNDEAAAALGGRMSAKAAGFRLRQARALGTDGLREAFRPRHQGRAGDPTRHGDGGARRATGVADGAGEESSALAAPTADQEERGARFMRRDVRRAAWFLWIRPLLPALASRFCAALVSSAACPSPESMA
jgi:DNA polymerase-3 subunit delta